MNAHVSNQCFLRPLLRLNFSFILPVTTKVLTEKTTFFLRFVSFQHIRLKRTLGPNDWTSSLKAQQNVAAIILLRKLGCGHPQFVGYFSIVSCYLFCEQFCSAFQSYQLPLYRSVRTWARFKPSTNFRQKEKEILDQVLDYSIYDYRIRPGGLVNDTSKCTFPF